jgi:hypothetical protein
MHLTYHDTTPSKDGDGANVEITEEMIAAGAHELLDYSRDYEAPENAVERIFLAMLAKVAPK